MKTLIGQLNPIVGDLDGNMAKIISAYDEGIQKGVDLVVLPEMMLTGYPLEDLVMRPSFMDAVEEHVDAIRAHVLAVVALAAKDGHPTPPTLIFGAPTRAEFPTGTNVGVVRNTAFVMNDAEGEDHRFDKVELPNYGVFDELRTFQVGKVVDSYPFPVRAGGTSIMVGVMICEDCWHPNVSRNLADMGAELLISINGSPYEIGKNAIRDKVVRDRIEETGLPFLYVNMVGGQDELVFDGGSFAYDVRFGYPRLCPYLSFKEFCAVYDSEDISHYENDPFVLVPSGVASVYEACVLGLRDYMRKQGFKSVVLGMSGGVDSGIVAAIACDAIGPENVELVRLPSKFSSDHSLTDAQEAAERLGAPMRTIAIEGVVDALRLAYSRQQKHSYELPTIYNLEGVADENIQARARGNILMAISNQEGHLLLSTGNRTEVSVGYATLYGDMSGGFNPIKDCYKTTVWAMCRWRNGLSEQRLGYLGFLGRAVEVVPEEIIVKPPSAELREDQKDSDSLPPYPQLDAMLKLMLEDEMSDQDIARTGYDPEHEVRTGELTIKANTIDGNRIGKPYQTEEERKAERMIEFDLATVQHIRGLVDRAEYKRRQACPGVKVTANTFGRDRRYPIVNHFRG